jgi:hypothetical protein
MSQSQNMDPDASALKSSEESTVKTANAVSKRYEIGVFKNSIVVENSHYGFLMKASSKLLYSSKLFSQNEFDSLKLSIF